MLYELILSKDGETWLVTSNDFPELTSFGDSREQALVNGLNAVERLLPRGYPTMWMCLCHKIVQKIQWKFPP